MERVAYGVFMWDGCERRSRRYGYFYPCHENFRETIEVQSEANFNLLRELEGKRVKIACRVLENRESGHAGDLALIPEQLPVMPEVGEVITVGIGQLSVVYSSGDPCVGCKLNFAFTVIPDEPRDDFWIDPKVFYRLHDQTVEFLICETDEECLPLTDVVSREGSGMIANGDGTFQAYGTNKPSGKVKPHIDKIEGFSGFFRVTEPSENDSRGTEYEIS